MEVHHHSHSNDHSKKWTHYLWEFLMLFLAVFCGFLAENQREHMVEHVREKQYMRSLSEDLKSDIVQLQYNERRYDAFVARLDSMAAGFNPSNYTAPPMTAYKQLMLRFGFPDFIYTDRTMQQLKNAGGMRLIRKKNVADSIAAYDAVVRRGIVHQDLVNHLSLQKITDKGIQLFDQTELAKLASVGYTGLDTIAFKKAVMLSTNVIDIKRFVNELTDYRSSMSTQRQFINADRLTAERLLTLIRDEYGIK